ncbi:thioredoxin-like protein [Russula earlei]|uniref:Thioredoxin-like protein n=1 Tax=Russula earlei TaxID=71964 RepID=A0ACC0U881_9AGAM|nr:thioredoxin-like protein [Russula earlei]
MFSAFKRSIPQISIFHNPSLPPSTKALDMLRAALSSPFPPVSASNSPLKFNLEVIESAPTADQIRTILDYLPRVRDVDDPHHVAALISSHPSSPSLPDRPHSPEGLVRLAQKTPLALKWPIVVDWTNGRASAGNSEGVGDVLEYLRKRRDGEAKEEEDYQPKGWFS